MNTKQTEARAGQKAAAKFQIKGHCGDWHHERKAKSVSIALKIFFFFKSTSPGRYIAVPKEIFSGQVGEAAIWFRLIRQRSSEKEMISQSSCRHPVLAHAARNFNSMTGEAGNHATWRLLAKLAQKKKKKR